MTRHDEFDGVLETTTPLMPVVTTGDEQERGIPLFLNADDGHPFPFDPWNLRDDGDIDSCILGVLANKAHGKTSTARTIAVRLGQRDADGEEMRIAAANFRRDDDKPEYEDTADFFDSTQIKLEEFSINLLDMSMGMTYAQQLGLMKVVFGHIFGIPKFSPAQTEVLRYGLMKVRELFPKTADLGVMALGLRTLNKKEIVKYRDQIYASTAKKHGGDPNFLKLIAERDGETGGKPKYKAKKFVEVGRLMQAAAELASMIEEAVGGEYGGIIGGSGSLAKVMEDRFISFDYSGLTDDQVALVETLLWYWKTAALINGDKRFEYHIEIHDENYMMWEFEVYARAMHRFMKQIRSKRTFLILLTHRFADWETVGKTDSHQYRLATNMSSDIDMWLIGKLDKAAAEDAGRRLKLTADEVAQIQNLELGHWGLKIGRKPIVWVRIAMTDTEHELSTSDSAVKKMVIR